MDHKPRTEVFQRTGPESCVITHTYHCGSPAHLRKLQSFLMRDESISGFLFYAPTSYVQQNIPNGAIRLVVTSYIKA